MYLTSVVAHQSEIQMLLNECLKTRSHVSRNLLKMMIKFELCGMLGMWDVRNIGSLGCGMFGLWDVRDVE